MKIIFFGCVHSSYLFLNSLLEKNNIEIVGIVTKINKNFNSDFYSLKEIALTNQIPYFLFDLHTNDELYEWCKKLSADVIYCLGWSHLLESNLLRLTKIGVLGYHPTELPKNRGRHPIIWALVLGLETTASTFFIMDEGADSGDIISQVQVKIDFMDNAASLYNKLMTVALVQLEKVTDLLVNGDYILLKQDDLQASYWRKRSKKDGFIDWRMPAIGIYNLIRALSRPYVGAHFEYKGQEIKVWDSKIISCKDVIKNREPGKIVKICNDGSVLVQCGLGVIRLIDYDYELVFNEGEYLL